MPANETAKRLWDDGMMWEDVLAQLRREGADKIASIKATRAVLRLPLGQAKLLVHESPTWADTRDRDERFHDALILAIQPPANSNRRRLDEATIASRLVGAVTALREGDLELAQQVINELLLSESPERLLILGSALTAALAEMGAIRKENLLAALGALVAIEPDSHRRSRSADFLTAAEKALEAS